MVLLKTEINYVTGKQVKGTKEEYVLQSREYKQKKQALAEKLEKLKIEKKKKESDTSSDMVEMLLQKFSETEELTNEIKSVMIEKVLVYGNNALEIYWKPDFAKYFECTELGLERRKCIMSEIMKDDIYG